MEIAIIFGLMTVVIGTVLATVGHFTTKQRAETHR
jgi:hypothetical protein